MNIARLLFRPWYWLAGKVFATWARPTVQPEAPADLLAGTDAPVCYVLETGGLTDTLALERLCQIHGLPSPTDSLQFGADNERRRIVVLRRKRGLIFRRASAHGSTRLKRLVEASIAAGGKELLLVPVAIYWGRSPQKEHSWLRLLFTENWDVAGRTRRVRSGLCRAR